MNQEYHITNNYLLITVIKYDIILAINIGGFAMILDKGKLYHAHLYGAKRVMENKNFLNNINVFPVPDGDTGSNLSSMMNVIVHESELKDTVGKTFESISDAALTGARGNSGIIFAQYFNGLSLELAATEQISLKNYADANKLAVKYAYEAI